MFCRIAFRWIVLIGAFAAGNSAAGAVSPTGNPQLLAMFLKMPLGDSAIDENAAPMRVADAGVPG